MTFSGYLSSLFEAWTAALPWITLAFARPIGFAILFAVFAWASFGSGILRLVFAVAVTVPLVALGLPGSEYQLEMTYGAILLKEVFIGLVLGLVSSIPLAIAVAGGGIIDAYRGVFSAGTESACGEVSPFGSLFAILALWLFGSIGGFQIITGTLYASYDVWAMNSAFPQFNENSIAVWMMLEKVLLGAVLLAAPLLIVMLLSDVMHMVASRTGARMDVTWLARSARNLILVILLPLFLVVAIRLFKNDLAFLHIVPGFVREFLV